MNTPHPHCHVPRAPTGWMQPGARERAAPSVGPPRRRMDGTGSEEQLHTMVQFGQGLWCRAHGVRHSRAWAA